MDDFRVSWLDLLRGAGLAEIGVSAVLHAAALFVLAMAMTTVDADDREIIARDQLRTMRAYLGANAGTGGGASQDDASGEGDIGLTDGAPGLGDPRSAGGRDGRGSEASRPLELTAARSPIREADESRTTTLAEFRSLSMIGLIEADVARSATPTVAWGPVLDRTDDTMGAEAWGASLEDVVGHGLGLSGGGEGGGGRGEGIAIGSIGSLGHLGGAGAGQGFGMGHCGDGCTGRGHVTRSPTLRCGGYVDEHGEARGGCATQVNGRLPPEVVQRVVHANFGRFRACYEAALVKNPRLEGRVSTTFVIARDGDVAIASEAPDSDLPDNGVRVCVVRAFSLLSFPRPAGGIVTVVYPLVFSPAE
jgi:hypothetical protein